MQQSQTNIDRDGGLLRQTTYLDDHPGVEDRRDATMFRLLDSCIRVLAEQGMKKLLIDAVKGGDDGFRSMGKQLPWIK